jgi:hypothetical protein
MESPEQADTAAAAAAADVHAADLDEAVTELTRRLSFVGEPVDVDSLLPVGDAPAADADADSEAEEADADADEGAESEGMTTEEEEVDAVLDAALEGAELATSGGAAPHGDVAALLQQAFAQVRRSKGVGARTRQIAAALGAPSRGADRARVRSFYPLFGARADGCRRRVVAHRRLGGDRRQRRAAGRLPHGAHAGTQAQPAAARGARQLPFPVAFILRCPACAALRCSPTDAPALRCRAHALGFLRCAPRAALPAPC